MPSRIVTSTYRYKRPPRKRKAVPLGGAGDRARQAETRESVARRDTSCASQR